jgi:hypothetical protein
MVRRVVFGFVVICAAFLFIPGTADATPGVVKGPCDGTGTFQKGGFTKTAAETGVVEIERSDDVAWQGSISGPSGELPYTGKIEVELPPPFGTLSIDSWSGTTDATSNSGTKHYDIPGAVPANVEFRVKGSHTQGSFKCTGSVKLKIKGSALTPYSVGSLVGTAATGAGLVVAGRAKGAVR